MTSPDTIGARLELAGRAAFSRDATAAARDIESLGPAADRAEKKSRGPLARIGSGVMSLGGMAVRAGAYAATGLGVMGSAAIGVGIKTAAGMETAQIGFTTMLGSAEKAQTFLADLSKFAAKTPFDLPGLQKSASSLVSAGIDADKVIPIMTSLGNATSGMGTGAEGIQRATVALQQMNAAQRITGEDLNQLRDAGIPVFDLLAAATGKSVKQVAELANKGKLGKKELDQLMGALESGKGLERFNGLMAKQSESMTGLWSTLKDTFSVGMAEAVQPLIPLIKDGLGRAIEFTAAMMPRIKSGLASMVAWGQVLYGIFFKGDYKGGLIAGLEEDSPIIGKLFAIRDNAIGLRDILFRGDFTGAIFGWEEDSKQVDILFRLREGVIAIKDAISALMSGDLDASKTALSGAGGGAMEMASSVRDLAAALPSLSDVLTLAAGVVGFVADNMDLLIAALPYLIAGFLLWRAAQAAQTVVAIANLPITAATISSNFALASANKALAFQMAVASGVERKTLAQRSAGVVLTGASAAAHGVMAAAIGVATAAQWLLNAAMSMNPLGLVIIAVIVLAALFVVLWKKSETFRNIVTGVFDALKRSAGNVVGFMIQGFRTLLMVWLTVADGIVSGAAAALGWVPGLGGKLKAANKAFDNMKDDILGTLDEAANAAYGFGEKTGKNVADGIKAGWSDLTLPVTVTASGQRVRGDVLTGGAPRRPPPKGVAAVPAPRGHGVPRAHSGALVTGSGTVNMQPDEELVVLPAAASVVPLPDKSGPIDWGGGDRTPKLIRVELPNGKVLAEVLYDEVRDEVARR